MTETHNLALYVVFHMVVNAHALEWTDSFHEELVSNGQECPRESVVFEMTRPSQASCAFKCLRSRNCLSVYYDESTEICQTCDEPCSESETDREPGRDMRCWNRRNGPHDCAELFKQDPGLPDGVYDVTTWAGSKVSVYCIMSELEGGWTVFIRRFDGSVRFNRTYAEYESLFGDLEGEHWLGLKTIHEMTAYTYSDMRLTLWGKQFVTGLPIRTTEQLSPFYVDRAPLYRLFVGNVTNSGYSPMQYYEGTAFSTFDTDNNGLQCSQKNGYGGWWYREDCEAINPTGIYMTPGTYDRASMFSRSFLGQSSLRNLTAMFKRRV